MSEAKTSVSLAIRLAKRITAIRFEQAQFPADNHYGAEIRVTRVDGRAVSGKIDRPRS